MPSPHGLPDDKLPEHTPDDSRRGFFARPPADAPRAAWSRWCRRVFGASSLAVLAMYCAGASAGFLYVHYRQQLDGVTWLDLAWPARWPRVRVAEGNRQIAAAQVFARAARWREALVCARYGVAHSPAHRDGRLLLAQLLAASGRPEAAQAALLEGFAFHHADPAFIGPLFDFLLQRQEDALVTALAWTVLSTPQTPAETRRRAALAGATARYFRGDYDHAENLLRLGPRLADSREGRLLLAQIEAARGWHELALVELRALAAEFPRDPEVHAELVQRLRASGRRDEARRVSLASHLAQPDAAAPRIELLRAYREAGDEASATREAAALLHDFAADRAALLALGDFAASAGDVALADRLAELARASQPAREPLALLAVEARIVARDYRGALSTLRALGAEKFPPSEGGAAARDSLQAVASFGVGDFEAARLALANVLARPRLRAENLLVLANRLVALDASEPARAVLARAVAADPLNQAALARLVALELDTNRTDALPAHLQQLAQSRRPSSDLLRVAQHKLGSDLYLFSAAREPALTAVRRALEQSQAAARSSG
ncbi:MAG TPA: hypothetical protein VHD62_18700 [Opitutaceae bacterium]|nr:hypothetical protein [Opitutaceae bacterium]